MGALNNPHDKFFKQVLGDGKNAGDFLRNYLPQDLLASIEIGSLEIQKDAFIEKELSERFSDILYKVRIKGKEGYIYFLFEHKSYPYQTIGLQLLKYMVSIWDQKVKKELQNNLPPIIALVIYHGKERWQLDHSFSSIIEGIEDLPDQVKRYIPDYQYLYYDFSPYSAEQIRGGLELKIFLDLLSAIFKEEADFLATVGRSIQALEELGRGQRALDYLETMIRYVLNAREDLSYDDVQDAVKQTSSTGGEMLMTIAEMLRNEGKIEGERIGKLEGKIEGKLEGKIEGEAKGLEMTLAALDAFREGKSLEEVMDLTGLDRDKLLQIQARAST